MANANPQAQAIMAENGGDDSEKPVVVSDPGIPKAPVDNGNNVPPDPAKIAEAKAKEAEAAKVLETKTAEDKIRKEAEDKVKAEMTWPTFDNEYAQSAVDLIKEAGVTIEESRAMFGKAMDTGDISTIDWTKVEAKIGHQKALLVKAGIEQYHAGEYQEVLSTVTYGHETMGGEAGWEKVRAWAGAKEKADPAFAKTLNSIRTGIKNNGDLAKISIDKLKSLYENDPKNSALTMKLVEGNTKPAPLGEALNRADYVAQLKKVHDTNAPNKNTLIAQLDARRREGRRLGM